MPRTEVFTGTELLARQVSPDGTLTLRVDRIIEGDEPLIVLGFEESGWHMHPSAAEALRIVDAVIADQVVIVSGTLLGEPNFELMSDLEPEVDLPGADVSYRLWSGPISLADLVDGKVAYTSIDDLWDWRIHPKQG